MVQRILQNQLLNLAQKYPVITISGPRQSGKTTLTKMTLPDKVYVNLERPDIKDFALNDPIRFLERYPEGAILDEFQNVPNLTSYIQVIVDDKPLNGRFILTGSRQFEIMGTVSQSLAGRTAVLKLYPFSLGEIAGAYPRVTNDENIFRGFYPRLIDQNIHPSQFHSDYLQTYIERDVRQIINVKNLALFEKFIRLCAGRTGQLLNLNSLAADTGINHNTAREWLSVLEASFVIHLVQPYYENIGKRLVKSPKLYFIDTGLACYLLGIENAAQIITHPLRGNLFENMAVIETLKFFQNRGFLHPFYFYRESNGTEADILIPVGGKLLAVEVKSAETIDKSYWRSLKLMEKQIQSLHPVKAVIYGGYDEYIREDIHIVSVNRIPEFLIKVMDAANPA